MWEFPFHSLCQFPEYLHKGISAFLNRQAQEVVNDLERAIQQGGDAPPPFKEPQVDIRSAAASERSINYDDNLAFLL